MGSRLAGLIMRVGCMPISSFLLIDICVSDGFYLWCFSDNAHGRIFTFQLPGSSTPNTIESCVAGCIANDFTVAGTEFAGKQEGLTH